MNTILIMELILDIETTGLPDRGNLPYGHYYPYKCVEKYNSSRIKQISFMLCDNKFNTIDLKDYYIDSSNVDELRNAFEDLHEQLEITNRILSHNINFCLYVVKSELYRLGMFDTINKIESKNNICTMANTKSIVGIKNSYGFKDPKLTELYAFATGEVMVKDDSSKTDVIKLHKAIASLIDKGKFKLL